MARAVRSAPASPTDTWTKLSRMHPPHSPRGWLVAALILLSSLARADDDPSGHQPLPPLAANSPRADEVWLISTRHLDLFDCEIPATYDLDIRRQDPQSGWQNSTLTDFLAGNTRLTVVYAHANRANWYDAVERGQQVYESLVSCGGDMPPLRFVIWSWPSDRLHGLRRDVRVKAARSDLEGSVFGWFLSKLNPDTPVGLIGYSYGARIISGGLHLLGGGILNGHTLPQFPKKPLRSVRAVYLAAAMDNEWLCSGSYHAQSLSQVDQLLIAYNYCDPALKRFRFIDPCTRPTALGFAGIDPACLDDPKRRVEQMNVSCLIGRSHAEDRYWCSRRLVHEIRRVVFEPLNAEVDPQPVPSVASQAMPVGQLSSADPMPGSQITSPEPSSAAGHRYRRSARFLGRMRR